LWILKGSSKLTTKYKHIIQSLWIEMAWQCLSPNVNVKGFKKCCISNAVDGTGEDMLWSGSAANGRGKCEEDEQTDCEDGDSGTDWQR